jgi:hypothetical protein
MVLFGVPGLGATLSHFMLGPSIIGKILYYPVPFFAAALVIAVIGVKKRAMLRFRELWNETHGAPVNP